MVKLKSLKPSIKGLRRKKARPSYPIVETNHDLESIERNGKKGFKINAISTTKYTRYNFVFKNLYEQFRRVTNIYFAAICIITLVPQVSPLSPVTSLLPLIFVLVVTAIKEGFEDFRRYQADKESNNREYLILRGGKFESVKSKDIKVGDKIKIENNQPFPADIIVLNSNLEDGVCYVETSQLDGETNLKMFKAIKETNTLSEQEILDLNPSIECELPSNNLYKFKGKLIMGENNYSLSEKQLMLRGARLRNTHYLIGIVVYCGKDSKLSLNQKNPPSKFSTIEKRLGRSVIGIFCFKVVLVIIATILGTIFNQNTEEDSWYFWNREVKDSDSLGLVIVKRFVAYFAILSFLIPMSLMVTLEVVKVSQARFMEWDKEMSYKEQAYIKPTQTPTDTPKLEGAGSALSASAKEEVGNKYMSVKNSNLNDELALIKYIFSDKTGTLTENKMVFSKCSINGVMYDNPLGGELIDTINQNDQEEIYGPIKEFLFNLGVCHAAVTDTNDEGETIFQSQSPDEIALIDCAKANENLFLNRSTTDVKIRISGEEKEYGLLAIMEFSSDRRRMSILLKDKQNDKIILYSKGADSIMLERLSTEEKNAHHVAKTIEHISDFSREGLRTLILAKREISAQEYEEWSKQYHEASTLIQGREEEIDRLNDQIEKDLLLIGCTAIEDKLQDGVPEAIDYLLKAGIKVWIITGDKQETAINIGYSCKLLIPEIPIIIINASSTEECGEQISAAVRTYIEDSTGSAFTDNNPHREISMVINGESLTFMLKDHTKNFLKLAERCHSVVCCRVTPLQKALIVRLVKRNTKEVCLSIGDGANDVSMIQEAQIGVGIFGNEGTQAARASDYSLLRFRHLTRLVTVHGRYSMVRNSLCIKFSFYKNMAFFLTQFWFSIYSGWTSQTLYDDWIVTTFNILMTSVPPYFIALFEKDVNEKVIVKNPQIYKTVQDCHLFQYSSVGKWLLGAFYHSLVFFFCAYAFFYNDDIMNLDGRIGGQSMMGSFVATYAVLTILFKASIEIKHWNFIVHIGIWGSMIVYLVIALVDSAIITEIPKMYWVFMNNLELLKFYCMVIIMIFIALLPDFTIKFARRYLFPKATHILQERYIKKMDEFELN
ncbi:hypothetical protein CYY_006711 [Polysphondylium violaceum]|uniref:Phospholipid-transporting ATPase n=1 Tax=Polysphondylium violaceum TaxID=133409 RepID=A0A8J4PT05_9MYCE|nr:hypothetical protein CYY_006711 [Polysphondylium violaceum]